MSDFDRFAELWTDYLEGELGEQAQVELREMLAANADYRSIASEMYQLHRSLGLVSKQDSEAFVSATMQRVPSSSEEFVANVVARVETMASHGTCTPASKSRLLDYRLIVVVVSTIAVLLLVGVLYRIKRQNETRQTSQIDTPIVFSNTARTKFLGAYAPAMGSAVEMNREYVLTSGSVQLTFPSGAQAIVEGPAIFQAHTESLKVSLGRCSVYCPAGAEGFLVDTPAAQVVDRGTRFFVSVAESSATEVHVVEGAADISRPSKSDLSPAPNTTAQPSNAKDQAEQIVRLSKHEARLFDNANRFTPHPTDYHSELYRSRLPDRILSYEATQENGGAKDLVSVRVQRDGQVVDYPAEQLIGTKLVWFKIEEKIRDMRHLAGSPTLPENRQQLLLDLALNTGAINPGGSVQPLNKDPVLPTTARTNQVNRLEDTTPGFAVEFVKPVVNCPGPDVLFFELQDLPGVPDGDSFHVMPLKFSGNRKAITIRSYDLTLTSPEVQRPSEFFLHEFEDSVDSIDSLLHADCHALPRPQGIANYRVIAVAIDLSAMGLEIGESVEGLFFQDSLDDANHVDPVAILGLPSTIPAAVP